MDPKEKELLRRAKIAAGLTPAQADAVISAQEEWDEDPANPANAQTAEKKAKKTEKAEKPEKGE